MKKMTVIGIIALILSATMAIMPTIGAANVNMLNNPTVSSLDLTPNEDVPEEFIIEYNDFLKDINNGILREERLIKIYDGIGYLDFEGARTDLTFLFGPILTDNLDTILKTNGVGDSPLDDINAMISTDEIRKSHENSAEYGKDSSVGEKFVEAKEDKITFDDFDNIDADKFDPVTFNPEAVYNDIMNFLNNPENSHLKTLLQNSCDALNEKKDDDMDIWDLATLILIGLWCVAWSGASMLPGWSPLPQVIGLLVGFGVASAVSLALDEAGVTDGIADVIRSLFPGSGLEQLDYEGTISFIFGAITFVLYFLTFEATRLVKVGSGALVFLGILIAIPLLIDELKKKINTSKPFLTILSERFTLLNNILTHILSRLSKISVIFN